MQRRATAGERDKEIEKTVNGYFGLLESLAHDLSTVETEFGTHLRALEARYAPEIQGLKERYAEVEKNLMGYARSKKMDIFAAADIFETRLGRLTRDKAEKVSIPRDAVAHCEEMGFLEAIRIAKSIDRATVEKWPDEKLFLIGAKRSCIEKISYELKTVQRQEAA